MLIRDVMTSGVITVRPEQSIADALHLIIEKHISFIVVASDNKPVGVLTEGDIVDLAEHDQEAESHRISDHMVSPVITLNSNINVFHAYDEILSHQIRYIVVVDDNGDLSGVITMSNFLASMGVEHMARLRHVFEEAKSNLFTVTADTSMPDVILAMNKHRHAMLAIEEGKVVGILTSRDITRLYHEHHETFRKKTMRDYMSSPVLTLPKHAFIPEANNLMKKEKTRHIVVVEDDETLFGLLTISDVVHSMEGKYISFLKVIMQEMEQDLQIRSVQQTALFERNPNAVFSLDDEGIILAINPACVLLTGLDEAKLIGTALISLLDQKDHQAYQHARLDALRGSSANLHASIADDSGQVAFVFLNLVPIIVDQESAGLYAVIHDVTERTNSDRHLRLLSSALEQASEAIILINEQGMIEFANQSFSQLFSENPGNLTGKVLDDLLSVAEYQDFQAIWQRVQEHGPVLCDTEIHLQAGLVLDAKISASSFKIDHEDASHLILIIEDMQERRDIEEQLRQAQKMEALGTLVGGIAHDFNNLLASISGNLFLIREEISGQSDTADKIEVLENECFRAAGLIQQLLVFARKGNVRKERLDLCALLHETLELGRIALSEQIELNIDIPKNPMYVQGNEQQLQQVMLNLINNAGDAVEYKVTPKIDIVLQWKKTTHHADGNAVLSIRDNGYGIQEQNLAHVFEPFFTTKEVGKGSGLGLSMAYGSIEQHQGSIEVQSRFSHGACFVITLPCLPLENESPIIHDLTVPKRYILVADDETRVREMCANLLQSRHYRVLLAESGEEALQLIEEFGDAIDLAVLDVMMPGLTGVDVWAHLSKKIPKLPVLLMTGYDRQNVTKGLPAHMRESNVLKKPFYPAEFLSRVQAMIGEYREHPTTST